MSAALQALEPIRLSLMLYCYLDDSGKIADSPFVVVAGYLANTTFWHRFNEMWRHMLLQNGVSQIHMKDLIGLNNEYKLRKWDEKRRDRVIYECIEIIRTMGLVGFGAAVDANHYKTLSRQRQMRFGTADQFCFQRVMRMVMDRMDNAGVEEKVSVMVDFDVEYASGRHKHFSIIRQRDHIAKRRLVSIAFGYSIFYPELQAADVLAWETRKEVMQKAGGFESRNSFIKLMTALPGKSFSYESELWDAKALDTEMARAEEELISRALDDPVSPKLP